MACRFKGRVLPAAASVAFEVFGRDLGGDLAGDGSVGGKGYAQSAQVSNRNNHKKIAWRHV